MNVRKHYYLIFIAVLLITQLSLSAENRADLFFASNSIGMLMEQLDGTDPDYEWIIHREYPLSENNEVQVYIDRLIQNDVIQWSETVSRNGNKVSVERIYSDGSSILRTYLDNLLKEEKTISIDNDEIRYVYTYYDGALIRINAFENEAETRESIFARKSDGSLHLLQTKNTSEMNPSLEIMILDSSEVSGRAVFGKRGDFSLISKLGNGLVTTEKWQNGSKLGADKEITADEDSGEYIISESLSTGQNLLKFYDSDARLIKVIDSFGESETTTTYQYDNSDRIVQELIESDDDRIIVEYVYSAMDILLSEITYTNGTVTRKVHYAPSDSSDGKAVEEYRDGKLYVTVVYNKDNATPKETILADQK